MAFYSRALGVNNKKLSIYEKEFMAIMMAVEKWRQYLQRGPFAIKTDHKSLCNLEDQVLHSELRKKAMTKLIGLQYKFQYQKGENNEVADALSRRGNSAMAISIAVPSWIEAVVNSYQDDANCKELMEQLTLAPNTDSEYTLKSGVLRYKGRIYVGKDFELRLNIIHSLHMSAVGGHSGRVATYQRVKQLFY